MLHVPSWLVLLPAVAFVVLLLALPSSSDLAQLCSLVAVESNKYAIFGFAAAWFALRVVVSTATVLTGRIASSTQPADSHVASAALHQHELNIVHYGGTLLLLFVAKRLESAHRAARLAAASEAALKKQALGAGAAYEKLRAANALREMAQRDDDGNAAAVLVDLAEENARLEAENARLNRDIRSVVQQQANAGTGLADMLARERAEKDALREQLRDLDRQLNGGGRAKRS
jgi:hypothetical protein